MECHEDSHTWCERRLSWCERLQGIDANASRRRRALWILAGVRTRICCGMSHRCHKIGSDAALARPIACRNALATSKERSSRKYPCS
jgi:hypothetical protein